MSDKQMSAVSDNRGYRVVAAGTGINLALGVLYAWSIFKGAIKESIERGGEGAFLWDMASLNDPYALCLLVFAFAMVLAGQIQDKRGPRVTAFIGGVCVGAGFLWISATTDYWQWMLGFGVLVGVGLAFGYAAATPAALKWFPPQKSGLISGIVVSGFGLASVYIAPLATSLLASMGISGAMQVLGIAFLLVVSALSFFLKRPPEGYKPVSFVERRVSGDRERKSPVAFQDVDFTPTQLLRQKGFWLLWLLYFIGAGAGLMVIGSIAGIAKDSLGSMAFLAVAILAVGNAAGRIVAGMMSDRFGRTYTLAALLFFQALLMFIAIPVAAPGGSPLLIVLVATLIGFNYGSNLSIFPSFAKDLWGMKHFGVNYGFLFTSWGVGGFVLSKISQYLVSLSGGSFTYSFVLAGVLLIVGGALALFYHDHNEKARRTVRNGGAGGGAGVLPAKTA